MKQYKLIFLSLILGFVLGMTANAILFASLYFSVRERCIADMEQCLRQADLAEMPDGLSDTSLIKHLKEAYMHELNSAGYHPKKMALLKENENAESVRRFWFLGYHNTNRDTYKIYISPLPKCVFERKMRLITAISIIALTLVAAFLYTVHLVGRQRHLDKMKTDFTDNMTHELKTPIAIARTSGDILLRFSNVADKTRIEHYASTLVGQLDNLTSLVDSILETSVEIRKRKLTKETFLLKPFLLALVELQSLRAPKECKFWVDCPEDTEITANKTILTHILNNLIDNSLKYSNEKVEIHIKADAYSLSVADNGIGIPKNAIRHIFKRFYRVDHHNQQERRGYGIGLFYVKSMVKKHRWRIKVTSEEGIGSKFTIKFKFHPKIFKR